MLNEEKRILCFETGLLDWSEIEGRIIDYYGLGEKQGCYTQEVNYGIMDAVIYTDKGIFDCEIGVLNQSEDTYLITVYPSRVLKELREEREKREKGFTKILNLNLGFIKHKK
jgi:hypothetical protein